MFTVKQQHDINSLTDQLNDLQNDLDLLGHDKYGILKQIELVTTRVWDNKDRMLRYLEFIANNIMELK